MVTDRQTPIPRRVRMSRSVEVLHGSRGVGRMLRRGLHGAKNWVLEPDGDGLPSSPWTKVGRTFIVLAPVWIALSAATGGPERGGQQVGFWQALFTALLVALVGLAFLSARERRQGREEPWSDLPALDTFSSDAISKTLVDPTPEAPTEVLATSQVSEVGDGSEVVTPGDNPDESDHTSHLVASELPTVVHEAGAFAEKEQVTAPFGVVHDPVQGAGSQGANQEKVDSPTEVDATPSFVAPTTALHETPEEMSFAQVSPRNEEVQEPRDVASFNWANLDTSDVAEGDDGLVPDEPTTPLRPAAQEALSWGDDASEIPQVSLTKEPLQQPVQEELQVLPAEAGPHPVTDGSIADDWFLTKPDVLVETGMGVDQAGASTTEEAPAKQTEEASAERPEEMTGKQVSESIAEQRRASLGVSGRPPDVVLMYLATQNPAAAFSLEQREEAKTSLITWVQTEVEEGRLSQADVARMLGVNRSTVSRWVKDDPWADLEGN